MPLEKYMLFVFKDFFINHLKINVSQEKELKKTDNLTLIDIVFLVKIDHEEMQVHIGYSKECIEDIRDAMLKIKNRKLKLEQKEFPNFAIEISTILLHRLRKYINEYDNRDINLSSPILSIQAKKTKYSIKRYFKIGKGYLISEY